MVALMNDFIAELSVARLDELAFAIEGLDLLLTWVAQRQDEREIEDYVEVKLLQHPWTSKYLVSLRKLCQRNLVVSHCFFPS
jgi:hypothetical protein